MVQPLNVRIDSALNGWDTKRKMPYEKAHEYCNRLRHLLKLARARSKVKNPQYKILRNKLRNHIRKLQHKHNSRF